MGRALEVSPLEICAAVVTANHFHQLLVVKSQHELSRYMQHFLGNLSKEVDRLRGRRGSLWERRYDSVIVSHFSNASPSGTPTGFDDRAQGKRVARHPG